MTAAIFISLEIAALTMLNNNGPIQRSWFGKIGQGFMGWVWGSTQKVSDYFFLKEQNDALAAENYRLTLLLADQKDSLFRDSLSRMVPPDNIAGDFIYIPAGISKISSNTQHNYIILDKGRADGVEENFGIITAKGVVGIVESVSENYCYALSFQNHQITVSARLRKDGPVGPIRWNGINADKAVLREIPHHIQHSLGDTVYTSGISDKFPSDIPIGTVAGSKLVNGSTFDIDVTLFEDLGSLRYAIIVGNIGNDEIRELENQMQ